MHFQFSMMNVIFLGLTAFIQTTYGSADLSFNKVNLKSGSCSGAFRSSPVISPGKYELPSSRPVPKYASYLGPRFAQAWNSLTKDDYFVDLGAGFGSATIQTALERETHSIAINTQDFIGYLNSLVGLPFEIIRQKSSKGVDSNWIQFSPEKKLGVSALADLSEVFNLGNRVLGRTGFIMATDAAPGRNYLQNEISSRIQNISQRIDDLKNQGKLLFLVGTVQEKLGEVKIPQNANAVFADLWGSVFYSADRLKLIQIIYSAMPPGSKAFVTFPQNIADRVSKGKMTVTIPAFLIKWNPLVFQYYTRNRSRNYSLVKNQLHIGNDFIQFGSYDVLEITKIREVPILDWSLLTDSSDVRFIVDPQRPGFSRPNGMQYRELP